MSNSKISALTSASTPLAGSETLPIVQSSATKQVSVANLTAGRAVSATSFTAGAFITSGNNQTIINSIGATGVNYLQISDQVTGGNPNIVAYGTDTNVGINFATKGTGDFKFFTGNLIPGTAAKGINFTANTPLAGMTSQLLNFYEEGTWTTTDASGASLSLTSNGTFYYTKVGRIATITFNITYPVTASTANAVIGSLPFTSIAANQTAAILGSNIALIGFKFGSTTTLAFYTAANAPVTNATLSGANIYGSVTYQTA